MVPLSSPPTKKPPLGRTEALFKKQSERDVLATVNGFFAERLFNTQQLIVLGDAI